MSKINLIYGSVNEFYQNSGSNSLDIPRQSTLIEKLINSTSLQAVVLETDWKISDISDKILSGGDVTAELCELEETLTETLKHSNIGVALRAELLIRLGQFLYFIFLYITLTVRVVFITWCNQNFKTRCLRVNKQVTNINM